MPESVFDKKKRVRPPRVNITYEVELGGAMVMKELPFVVGVVSDLSGNPKEPLGKLKDRKFVNIDRDNFDDVLASMAPRLAFKVENKLKDDGSQLGVELNFKSLDDFRPEAIAEQLQPMTALPAVRTQPTALLRPTDGIRGQQG